MRPSQSSTLDTESEEGQAMMDKDIEILRRMLSQPGRWLVHVHSGHIVKVARVAPEMSADAVLDDAAPMACPKSAVRRIVTR